MKRKGSGEEQGESKKRRKITRRKQEPRAVDSR
jgi:hypothetical protein